MGTICRAFRDCLSCVSQHNLGCIWEKNGEGYPCKAGYMDAEISKPTMFFTKEAECTVNVDVPIIEVPVISNNLAVIFGLGGLLIGVLITLIAIRYIKKRRHDLRRSTVVATDSGEQIELIPRENGTRTLNQSGGGTDTDSEFTDVEILNEIARFVKAGSNLLKK